MKVCFSSDIFEQQVFGGVSRYFVELAENLERIKLCEVAFPFKLYRNYYLRNSYLAPKSIVPSIISKSLPSKIVSLVNSKSFNVSRSNQFFDIRHETFFGQQVDVVKARMTVTTIYDMIREKFHYESSQPLRKKISIERADKVIAISNTTKMDIVEILGVDEDKISTIHLGVNPLFMSNSSHIANKSTNQLIYVGERGGYKNFQLLIHAFSQSHELRDNFKVVVFGKPFMAEELQLLHQFGLRKNFDQKNGDDQRLATEYANSVGLIVTSRYEGFGLPVLEAMASGCVVFSTRGGALEEIGASIDIPFSADEPASLAYQMCKNLSDTSELLERSRRGVVHASSFTWEKCARETFKVYESGLEQFN